MNKLKRLDWELARESARAKLDEECDDSLKQSHDEMDEMSTSLDAAHRIASIERDKAFGDTPDSRDVALIAEAMALGFQTVATTMIYCVRLWWAYKRDYDKTAK